jgi:hypothetical protein
MTTTAVAIPETTRVILLGLLRDAAHLHGWTVDGSNVHAHTDSAQEIVEETLGGGIDADTLADLTDALLTELEAGA